MNIRLGVAALAVAGAAVITSAAPALADGPPVPPGCTFDQATGVQTCVTTTSTTTTVGPFNTDWLVPLDTTVGGVITGAQACALDLAGGAPVNYFALSRAYFHETVTTTTTTEQHGLNGKVYDTSTVTSPPSFSYASGSVACAEFD